MATLLHIDSSPLGEHSISRHLTAEFVATWKRTHGAPSHTESKVLYRDLAQNPSKPIDAEWIGASFTPIDQRNDQQKQALASSEELIAELTTADEYVFGLPMHNFTIPAVLKLWIDQVARPGRTFAYENGVPKGLLNGKKATFLIASAGVYDAGTQMASLNFAEPYLRSVFGFFGVTDVRFLNAGGVAAVQYGQVDRATFLKPHLESIQAGL